MNKDSHNKLPFVLIKEVVNTFTCIFFEITTLIDAVQNYTANANKLRSKISRLRFHILASVYWKIPRYFQFLFFSGIDLTNLLSNTHCAQTAHKETH